ncbi:MAG: UDP-N-acetylglucosamine 2-epimerase (non-hydrolyzing) [Emcibacteraceae bacterium]|nr:UDP-N-acetylglucosamine 2-epimerase (non-hydrolyzing) [Emcibacteraceae bacterium]
MTKHIKTVLVFFGTRPEALKMEPVISALKKQESISVKVCNTGQHYELLNSVLKEFEIEVDYTLAAMRPGQSLNVLTSKLILSCDEVITGLKPDLVLVHGDTCTTFAASFAAFQAGVPIAHIEAGLRTHNLKSPWPEEANRKLTSVIADWHFAPTSRARENLIDEGIPEDTIFITGNTIIDMLFKQLDNINKDHVLREDVAAIAGFNLQEEEFVLITGHRRENFGNGFKNICEAIKSLSKKFPSTYFVFPVHLNPNVRQQVEQTLSNLANVKLIEPVNYHHFLYLMNCCKLILTDSGGIQEEAPSLNKPVIIMRDTTERPEIVTSGAGILAGSDEGKIVEYTSTLLTDTERYDEMSHVSNPFGDGTAADKIADIIVAKIR